MNTKQSLPNGTDMIRSGIRSWKDEPIRHRKDKIPVWRGISSKQEDSIPTHRNRNERDRTRVITVETREKTRARMGVFLRGRKTTDPRMTRQPRAQEGPWKEQGTSEGPAAILPTLGW